jgi:riboflavin synthase
MGVIGDTRTEADSHWLTIRFPEALGPLVIHKGSIAVDGISLTVAALRDEELDVMIIPYTWAHTTLSHLRPADTVNLECDMIGKYVIRALGARRS